NALVSRPDQFTPVNRTGLPPASTIDPPTAHNGPVPTGTGVGVGAGVEVGRGVAVAGARVGVAVTCGVRSAGADWTHADAIVLAIAPSATRSSHLRWARLARVTARRSPHDH